MTAHGEAGASNEQGGTADEGHARRRKASEWRRRGRCLAAEIEHVGSANFVHLVRDHMVLFGLRPSVEIIISAIDVVGRADWLVGWLDGCICIFKLYG